jgi:YegS/Rv2252/BmrU family lipid kinase
MSLDSALDLTRKRVAILANPRAGTGKSQRLVESLFGALRGRRLSPLLCWEREKLSELVQNGEAQELRCVVAAGGDGTLLEVLNRAPGVPVALLPLGNENLVARFCRVPRDPHQVANTIVAGQTRCTDLARLNDRLFCVMAGVGVDAEVVHRVHAARKGHINKLSYAVPILQSLSGYRYPRVDVEIVETGERLQGAMVFVFNIPQYALSLRLAPGADPADGLLDVYVFERPGLRALMRYLSAVVRGKQLGLPDHHHRTAKQVRLTSSERAPIQTDGDPAGFLPATLAVEPAALTIVVGR